MQSTSKTPLKRGYPGKRVFDVVVAGLALPFAELIIWHYAKQITKEDGGPALFSQERMGQDNRVFTVWKLRTMQNGKRTALGEKLSRRRIDELPQLRCVLRGTMSMVGPRPHSLEDVARFSAEDPEEYNRRHELKPGLVSELALWTKVSHAMRVMSQPWQLDIAYARKMSFWFDFCLCLRAAAQLLWQQRPAPPAEVLQWSRRPT